MSTSLAALPVGSAARVVDVSGTPEIQQRLHEFGLLPGVEIKLVRTAPLGCPLEIELLGYSLSLRKSDAAEVLVDQM